MSDVCKCGHRKQYHGEFGCADLHPGHGDTPARICECKGYKKRKPQPLTAPAPLVPSEAAVEKAAEEIYAERGYGGITKTDTNETRHVWECSQDYARAALVAAYPTLVADIREQLAQEIEDYHAIGSVDWHRDWELGRTLAARIVRGDR